MTPAEAPFRIDARVLPCLRRDLPNLLIVGRGSGYWRLRSPQDSPP